MRGQTLAFGKHELRNMLPNTADWRMVRGLQMTLVIILFELVAGAQANEL